MFNKSKTSDSLDSCPYDDPKEDLTSTCSDENNDHSDRENIDLSGSNSESSCTNNDVQEFLIPEHENTPDPNDICGLKWGRDHYIRFLPSLKRRSYT